MIAADFVHDIDDFDRATGGFTTAVEFLANAASIGLFFVFDEKDFVNDGDGKFERELLQAVGD